MSIELGKLKEAIEKEKEAVYYLYIDTPRASYRDGIFEGFRLVEHLATSINEPVTHVDNKTLCGNKFVLLNYM